MAEKLPIKEWKEDERPREKMAAIGAENLSDAELAAIIIGSGNREESALDLARRILSMHDNCLRVLMSASAESLMSVKGIGKTKAITLLAAAEIGKRVNTARTKEFPEIHSSGFLLVTKCYREVILDQAKRACHLHRCWQAHWLHMKFQRHQDPGYPQLIQLAKLPKCIQLEAFP